MKKRRIKETAAYAKATASQGIQKTVDRMKEIVPITKVPFDYAQDRRNLESTKKDLVFYITPSSFVLSYLRVFVVSS